MLSLLKFLNKKILSIKYQSHPKLTKKSTHSDKKYLSHKPGNKNKLHFLKRISQVKYIFGQKYA